MRHSPTGCRRWESLLAYVSAYVVAAKLLTKFGSTDVAIHGVSVAAELGDASEALDAADSVDLDHLPEGLRSRRAHVHLDLAWAQCQRKRDAEAVLHLLEAERTAPEAVHYNVVVRELIREMLVGRVAPVPARCTTWPCAPVCWDREPWTARR